MDSELARLLKEVAAEAPDDGLPQGVAAFDPRVMAALGAVPRHEFIAGGGAGVGLSGPAAAHRAWTNHFPAVHRGADDGSAGGEARGHGAGGGRAGSGYRAAVLAKLVKQVHTAEIVQGWHRRAGAWRWGVENVKVHEGDGAAGLPEEAPFDGILVAAAAPSVPAALAEQGGAGGW